MCAVVGDGGVLHLAVFYCMTDMCVRSVNVCRRVNCEQDEANMDEAIAWGARSNMQNII